MNTTITIILIVLLILVILAMWFNVPGNGNAFMACFKAGYHIGGRYIAGDLFCYDAVNKVYIRVRR